MRPDAWFKQVGDHRLEQQNYEKKENFTFFWILPSLWFLEKNWLKIEKKNQTWKLSKFSQTQFLINFVHYKNYFKSKHSNFSFELWK